MRKRRPKDNPIIAFKPVKIFQRVNNDEQNRKVHHELFRLIKQNNLAIVRVTAK